MPTMEERVEEIKGRIRQHIVYRILLKKDERILNMDDSLMQAGIIDSLGIQMLITFLEREYQIAIPEEELYPENFETINDIANLVIRIKK
jgi:acyl carrier protein